ncbi:MAG: STAS/SEC14 domain-containing protein [Helicobacteraceae bacterium CG2_30_36_10]|nr:MAG: STAS/SEC14 domain-containing protein [Helicobacteraceae bacterium CG2_30_36_10]
MNANLEHGISAGISRIDNYFFMKIKINGTLTHGDYNIMVPMLREAIEGIENPNVKILIDATNFDGWELRAAWDDFKFGIEFRDVFSKIAFVGTKAWEEYGVKIGGWFLSGEIKFFKSIFEAYLWLNEEEATLKTPVEKDLISRRNEIREDLDSLFKSNLKRTDWNVPEADDQKASETIVAIIEERLSEIKKDVKDGKYKGY